MIELKPLLEKQFEGARSTRSYSWRTRSRYWLGDNSGRPTKRWVTRDENKELSSYARVPTFYAGSNSSLLFCSFSHMKKMSDSCLSRASLPSSQFSPLMLDSKDKGRHRSLYFWWMGEWNDDVSRKQTKTNVVNVNAIISRATGAFDNWRPISFCLRSS